MDTLDFDEIVTECDTENKAKDAAKQADASAIRNAIDRLELVFVKHLLVKPY